MSDLFFENVKNIHINKTETTQKKLNFIYHYNFNSKFVSIEYNLKGHSYYLAIILHDNTNIEVFTYLVDLISSTNDKSILHFIEVINDWFEVKSIQMLSEIKEIQERQSLLL